MIVVLTVLLTFIAMEAVAWWMHKYIMHGLGWIFHAFAAVNTQNLYKYMPTLREESCCF